ncbi:MAG: hypothetical protein AB7R69_03240 [Candidatus Babeliales bacterium]
MKKFFLSFLLISCVTAQGSFESIVHEVKERVQDARCYSRYYGPYVVGAPIALSGFTVNKEVGLSIFTLAGLYSVYAAVQGYREIRDIAHKYAVTPKAVDYWNNFYSDEPFLLCRWRQQDDRYNDGYYWPTAWLCHEEQHMVRKKLIEDVHAQRIAVTLNGKKITQPKPSQLMQALTQEIQSLEQDKCRLQAYTPIYRSVEQPEDFHPALGISRILWPNYNRASQLYIDIVQMMKRLEVLRSIVGKLRSELVDDRWPKA